MSVPMILGCGSDTIGATGDAGNETDYDASSGDTDVDVDADSDVDGDSDVDTDVDSDVDTDTGTGTDTDTVPDTPLPPGASLYSDAPCAFPASITYHAAENRLYVTCGMPGSLWRSAELGTAGDWTQAGDVPGFPSNHVMLGGQFAVVAHSAPDGLTVLDYTDGTVAQEIELSALTILDDLDEPLDFTPNYPAGLYFYAAGDQLFVATSNLDYVDYADPALTTFFAGTVVYLDYEGTGTFDLANVRALETSGVNPTGIAAVGANAFAVLSAGPYEPSADSEAALDIFALPDLTASTTDLGAITGQASPVMPVTAGGLILIGVQKPENGIMGVDMGTAELILDRAMPDADNFISNICAHGDVAALSDFGEFGMGSQVLFAHTSEDGWTGIPIAPISTGSSGPAVLVGDTLYQTVTANDGMSASIWELNMGGMD